MRILYIEDDATARQFIERGLSEQGFTVTTALNGVVGLRKARESDHDLILLDVKLPKLDGFALLKQLRERDQKTPVLILSARTEVSDRIQGLTLGADDYLGKPFAFGELVARIHAILRRGTRERGDDELIAIGDLHLDRQRRVATRGDNRVQLTPKEFMLLELLMSSQGQILSRSTISERVWGYDFESFSNVIDVHINRLRQKIANLGIPNLIQTVKGVGYVIDRDPAQGP